MRNQLQKQIKKFIWDLVGKGKSEENLSWVLEIVKNDSLQDHSPRFNLFPHYHATLIEHTLLSVFAEAQIAKVEFPFNSTNTPRSFTDKIHQYQTDGFGILSLLPTANQNIFFVPSAVFATQWMKEMQKHKEFFIPRIESLIAICREINVEIKDKKEQTKARREELRARPLLEQPGIERDSEIFKELLEGYTFAEVGRRYNISSSRTQQIYSKLMRLVRQVMKVEQSVNPQFTIAGIREKFPRLFPDPEHIDWLSVEKGALKGDDCKAEREFVMSMLAIHAKKKRVLRDIQTKARQSH